MTRAVLLGSLIFVIGTAASAGPASKAERQLRKSAHVLRDANGVLVGSMIDANAGVVATANGVAHLDYGTGALSPINGPAPLLFESADCTGTPAMAWEEIPGGAALVNVVYSGVDGLAYKTLPGPATQGFSSKLIDGGSCIAAGLEEMGVAIRPVELQTFVVPISLGW